MSLNEIWEASAGSPFHPVVAKERQFLVAFTLLLTGKLTSEAMKSQDLILGLISSRICVDRSLRTE